MLNSKQYIESGILEQYVLGFATEAECKLVEELASTDPLIKEELDAIYIALETFAMANAIPPDETIKPFLMATIDYTERLKNGEPLSLPPLLNERSSIADYSAWLDRSDMIKPATAEVYAKLIGFTPEVSTAIVWIKDQAPHEVHDNEFERFLIVEGSCDIIVGDKVNQLTPGDYFEIPLHKSHIVKVTSAFPCKIILQRVAA